MKKSKVMSIVAAAVLASCTAVSVNAMDYGVANPIVTRPGNTNATPAPANPESSSSGSSSTGSSAAKETTVVSTNSVARAAATGKAIKASANNAEVKSNAVAALAKVEGGTLNVKTSRFSVSIAADSVTEVKDINLGIKMTKSSKAGALILKTVQKGEYGCTLKMSIPSKIYSQAGVDLDSAMVYVVDPETKKATPFCEIEVDDNGNITFDITDGGNYIIL